MPQAPWPGNQVVSTADTRAPGVPTAVFIMSLTAQGHLMCAAVGKGKTSGCKGLHQLPGHACQAGAVH